MGGPEPFSAFLPAPLPPIPGLNQDSAFQALQERATLALGRLDEVGKLLPDPHLFLYMYVRKEAVLSSQIEGTQSSLSDLLLFEDPGAPGVPEGDAHEVSNYVQAMEHGLTSMRKVPLSLRLIKEIHGVLMKGTRGGDKQPGEFRRSQNWVGGTRPGNALYVPPPPHEVPIALGALEKFLHGDPVQMPTLLKAGMAHAQFESIHPFLDGNGRLGRLLITFVLCSEGALSKPLLYLSLHFKEHRKEYYAALQRVREEGDWEGWMSFYLEGVEAVAGQACETARKIMRLFEQNHRKIQELGKAAATAARVHDLLKKHCIISLPTIQKELKVAFPTAAKAMHNLEKLSLVREYTGKRRNRCFAYDPYLRLLQEGTEPIRN